MQVLTAVERIFVEQIRVARLATADESGMPHVVPVCFNCTGNNIYITIDEKPKVTGTKPLKRIRNIEINPKVSLVLDRYEEDWSRLAWVLISGHADILNGGKEHMVAQESLCFRYPQLTKMVLDELPVIAVRIKKIVSWGALD